MATERRTTDERPRTAEQALIAIALIALLDGAALRVIAPDSSAGRAVWLVGLVVSGAPLVWRTARAALRGVFAVDVLATLSIVGAVALGEPVAGLVIVLMQSGGEALERRAARRASLAVRELEASAPRIAHRIVGHALEDIVVEAVAPGDLLVVRAGEMVPCDSVVLEGTSAVDASRLTGEPVPVTARVGSELASGAINGVAPLTVRAIRPSRESQYARIVALVRSAQASKAPLQRLADRYATWLTPLVLVVCAATYLVTRDPLRVLAVLVVATPCPLILATPVAVVGGIDAAARRRLLFRHGGALEQLATVTTAVFDKTGTLTVGSPSVRQIAVAPGVDRAWLLAALAALERRSSHPLARSLVEAIEREQGEASPVPGSNGASERGPHLDHASVVESPGEGMVGTIGGRRVAIGGRAFVGGQLLGGPAAVAWLEGGRGDGASSFVSATRAYASLDGEPAGLIEYEDAIRPGLASMMRELGELGVGRVLLLSGDNAPNAEAVAKRIGIADVRGDLRPHEKASLVAALVDRGERVVMLGDGINDAPALSAATVGAALAAHGGGITAEAADVVILADDPTRLVEAIRIGRRTMRIAKQSIAVGLGLSAIAVLVAAVGDLRPTLGALLQEGIDVAAIANALRTSWGSADPRRPRGRPASSARWGRRQSEVESVGGSHAGGRTGMPLASPGTNRPTAPVIEPTSAR